MSESEWMFARKMYATNGILFVLCYVVIKVRIKNFTYLQRTQFIDNKSENKTAFIPNKCKNAKALRKTINNGKCEQYEMFFYLFLHTIRQKYNVSLNYIVLMFINNNVRNNIHIHYHMHTSYLLRKPLIHSLVLLLSFSPSFPSFFSFILIVILTYHFHSNTLILSFQKLSENLSKTHDDVILLAKENDEEQKYAIEYNLVAYVHNSMSKLFSTMISIRHVLFNCAFVKILSVWKLFLI